MPPRPRPSSPPRPSKVLQPGGGETRHVLQDVATFKVNANDGQGAFSVIELDCQPGSGMPLHVHDVADHVLYVLQGTFALTIGLARETLPPGACAMIPCGQLHGFVNVGDGPGRMLVIATPPTSEERVFLQLAAMLATGPDGSRDMTSAIRLLGARHGLDVASTRDDASRDPPPEASPTR